MTAAPLRLAVIGAGSWGTALAALAVRNGVRLWVVDGSRCGEGGAGVSPGVGLELRVAGV